MTKRQTLALQEKRSRLSITVVSGTQERTLPAITARYMAVIGDENAGVLQPSSGRWEQRMKKRPRVHSIQDVPAKARGRMCRLRSEVALLSAGAPGRCYGKRFGWQKPIYFDDMLSAPARQCAWGNAHRERGRFRTFLRPTAGAGLLPWVIWLPEALSLNGAFRTLRQFSTLPHSSRRNGFGRCQSGT